MISLNGHRRYLLYRQPVNINKGFYSLAAIAREHMQSDPQSTDLFIFLNRRCTQMKILSWEGDGFSIYHKKLEKGTFELPAESVGNHLTITHHQLILILQGIMLNKVHYRKRYCAKNIAR